MKVSKIIHKLNVKSFVRGFLINWWYNYFSIRWCIVRCSKQVEKLEKIMERRVREISFFGKKELRIALSRKYNPVERSVMILLWQCMRNASSSSKYIAKKRGEFKADRGGKQLPETHRIKRTINFNRVKTMDADVVIIKTIFQSLKTFQISISEL